MEPITALSVIVAEYILETFVKGILQKTSDTIFNQSIEDKLIIKGEIEKILLEEDEEDEHLSSLFYAIFDSISLKPLIIELFTYQEPPRKYSEIKSEIIEKIEPICIHYNKNPQLVLKIILNSILKNLQTQAQKNYLGAHVAIENYHRKREKYLQYPAFETVTKYISKNKSNLIDINIPLESYSIIEQKMGLFHDSNYPFLIITSQGNSGKTHFLKKIVISLQSNHIEHFIKILNLGAYSWIQSCESELDENTNYIILLDDADDDFDKSLDFLFFIQKCRQDIKVIISVRQSRLSELQIKIDERNLSGCVFEKQFLIQWTDKELLELLHQSSTHANIPDEALIIERYKIPSLL